MVGLHRFHITFNTVLHDFMAARHPSEAGEWFVTRVLAMVLHYEEGLTFSKGVCHGQRPALFSDGAMGRLKTWIDIGSPSQKKLRLGLRTADRLILYSYGQPALLQKALAQCPPGRVEAWSLERRFLQGLAALVTTPTLCWPLSLDGEQLVVAGRHGIRSSLIPP